MPIHELWAPRDEDSARRLRDAALLDDLGAALLAIEGASDEQARLTSAALNLLACQAHDQILTLPSVDHPGPHELTHVLRGVLAGFSGDRDDYHAPHNSHLSRVVSRQRGLPILLSCVWMLVGNDAGCEVQGLGMPGHFLVRVGGEGGVIVDPFSGGRALSPEDCRRLVERVSGGATPWRDSFLRAVTTGELLERVLRNLLNAYTLARDPAQLYRAARLWAALRPEAPEPAALVHQIEQGLGLLRPRSRAN